MENTFIKENADGSMIINPFSSKHVVRDSMFVNSLPSTTVNNGNRFSAVFDCDEVLVNISDKWARKMLAVPELKKLIPDSMIQAINMGVMNLRIVNFIDRLLGIEFGSKEYETFMSLYKDDPTFYDDLPPSPFLNSVKRTINFYDEIHILTKMPTDEKSHVVDASKQRFLVNHLLPLKKENPSLKINILFLKANEKKSDAILEQKIKFNTFADDSTENIVDVVSNVTNRSYEVLVPMYGYNYKSLEEIYKIENRTVHSFAFMYNFDSPHMNPDLLKSTMFKLFHENEVQPNIS